MSPEPRWAGNIYHQGGDGGGGSGSTSQSISFGFDHTMPGLYDGVPVGVAVAEGSIIGDVVFVVTEAFDNSVGGSPPNAYVFLEGTDPGQSQIQSPLYQTDAPSGLIAVGTTAYALTAGNLMLSVRTMDSGAPSDPVSTLGQGTLSMTIVAAA